MFHDHLEAKFDESYYFFNIVSRSYFTGCLFACHVLTGLPRCISAPRRLQRHLQHFDLQERQTIWAHPYGDTSWARCRSARSTLAES